jgi:ribosomal protein S18 acetylase RimI-like enzyme
MMKSMPAKHANHKPPQRPTIGHGPQLETAKTMLREYAPADFDALYELDRICYPRGIAYSKRTLRWFLAQRGAICLIAEINSKIAGFILADRQGRAAHIITIDVVPGERRHGIGTVMMAEVEKRLAALGVRDIYLETATNNAAGAAFWQRHGFHTVGLMTGYYFGRQDAYAMAKRLPDRRP